MIYVYAGDTASKGEHFNYVTLKMLGVEVDSHGKMPDVVLHYQKKGWLVLVEAVTSHGPVDAKRHRELEKRFSMAKPGLFYVTAFPNCKTMAKDLTEIGWETEVWAAEAPTYMIHFNGERFLGPYGCYAFQISKPCIEIRLSSFIAAGMRLRIRYYGADILGMWNCGQRYVCLSRRNKSIASIATSIVMSAQPPPHNWLSDFFHLSLQKHERHVQCGNRNRGASQTCH